MPVDFKKSIICWSIAKGVALGMLKKFCHSYVLDMGISVRRDNTACELSFKFICIFVMETPEGKC